MKRTNTQYYTENTERTVRGIQTIQCTHLQYTPLTVHAKRALSLSGEIGPRRLRTVLGDEKERGPVKEGMKEGRKAPSKPQESYPEPSTSDL